MALWENMPDGGGRGLCLAYGETVGMFGSVFELFVVSFDEFYLLLGGSCREEGVFPHNELLFVVDGVEDDGNPGSRCDIVEAVFPVLIAFSCPFGGDGEVECGAFPDFCNRLFDQRGPFAPVHRDSPDGLPEVFEREEEPFFFHQEARAPADGSVEQLGYEKVPVARMRGYAEDALGKIRDGDLAAPSQYFEKQKATNELVH